MKPLAILYFKRLFSILLINFLLFAALNGNCQNWPVDSLIYWEKKFEHAFNRNQPDSAYYHYLKYQDELINYLRNEQTNSSRIILQKEILKDEESALNNLIKNINDFLKRQELLNYSVIFLSIIILFLLGITGLLIYKKRINIQTSNLRQSMYTIRYEERANQMQKEKVQTIAQAIAGDIQHSTMPMVDAIIKDCDLLNDRFNDDTLQTIMDIAKQAKTDLTHLHLYINMPELFNWNISKQLTFITRQLLPHYAIQFNVSNQLTEKSQPSSVQCLHINRIILELVKNTLEHSQATHIDLSIRQKDDLLYIHYKDNGIGITTVSNPKKGIGHMNIMQRVDQLNGSILQSDSLSGFETMISFPFT